MGRYSQDDRETALEILGALEGQEDDEAEQENPES